MCASYWNLDVPNLICPKCNTKSVSENLQTHYNGESGDCTQYYKLNEPVPNLGNMTGKLSNHGDWFVTQCFKCNASLDYDGIIREGAVVEVIPRKERK